MKVGPCSVDSARTAGRNQTFCVLTCVHSECVSHPHLIGDCALVWCADRESYQKTPPEVLMLVCVAHQDVCRSSRVVPLHQTPGGPHQEGKSCSTVLNVTLTKVKIL